MDSHPHTPTSPRKERKPLSGFIWGQERELMSLITTDQTDVITTSNPRPSMNSSSALLIKAQYS